MGRQGVWNVRSHNEVEADAREIINLRTVGVLGINFRQRHGVQSNPIVLDSGVDHVVVHHSSVR